MSGPRPLGIPTLGGVVTEFAADGAARIHFKVAPGLHRVPDGIATAAVGHQLRVHIGHNWIACLILSSGHAIIRPSGPGAGTPDRQMQALLSGIAIALNHHEARDGHWVVFLNLDEHEIGAIWRDQGGDAAVAYELGEPAKLLSWSATDFAAHADKALDTWKERTREIGLRQNQMIRRALGEKPPVH